MSWVVTGLIGGLSAIALAVSIGSCVETIEGDRERAESKQRNAKGLAERDAAGQRCVDQGDVPVMGYGFSVICIDGAAVVEYTKPDYGDEP